MPRCGTLALCSSRTIHRRAALTYTAITCLPCISPDFNDTLHWVIYKTKTPKSRHKAVLRYETWNKLGHTYEVIELVASMKSFIQVSGSILSWIAIAHFTLKPIFKSLLSTSFTETTSSRYLCGSTTRDFNKISNIWKYKDKFHSRYANWNLPHCPLRSVGPN